MGHDISVTPDSDVFICAHSAGCISVGDYYWNTFYKILCLLIKCIAIFNQYVIFIAKIMNIEKTVQSPMLNFTMWQMMLIVACDWLCTLCHAWFIQSWHSPPLIRIMVARPHVYAGYWALRVFCWHLSPFIQQNLSQITQIRRKWSILPHARPNLSQRGYMGFYSGEFTHWPIAVMSSFWRKVDTLLAQWGIALPFWSPKLSQTCYLGNSRGTYSAHPCIMQHLYVCLRAIAQITKLTEPKWALPGSCRPQIGPILAPWTLLSGRGNSAPQKNTLHTWMVPPPAWTHTIWKSPKGSLWAMVRPRCYVSSGPSQMPSPCAYSRQSQWWLQSMELPRRPMSRARHPLDISHKTIAWWCQDSDRLSKAGNH